MKLIGTMTIKNGTGQSIPYSNRDLLIGQDSSWSKPEVNNLSKNLVDKGTVTIKSMDSLCFKVRVYYRDRILFNKDKLRIKPNSAP